MLQHHPLPCDRLLYPAVVLKKVKISSVPFGKEEIFLRTINLFPSGRITEYK